MSLDLTLIPAIESITSREFSYVALPLEHNIALAYDIKVATRKLKLPSVSKGFRSYPTNEYYYNNDDRPQEHYDDVPETPSGGPLKKVTVEFLMQFKDHKDMSWPSVKAAWAYLGALDPKSHVALWFH